MPRSLPISSSHPHDARPSYDSHQGRVNGYALVAFAVVAVLAGMLAAILPARRASRLNILSALQYE